MRILPYAYGHFGGLFGKDSMVLSRGARCHVNLRLEDHTKVETGEFVP